MIGFPAPKSKPRIRLVEAHTGSDLGVVDQIDPCKLKGLSLSWQVNISSVPFNTVRFRYSALLLFPTYPTCVEWSLVDPMSTRLHSPILTAGLA